MSDTIEQKHPIEVWSAKKMDGLRYTAPEDMYLKVGIFVGDLTSKAVFASNAVNEACDLLRRLLDSRTAIDDALKTDIETYLEQFEDEEARPAPAQENA